MQAKTFSKSGKMHLKRRKKFKELLCRNLANKKERNLPQKFNNPNLRMRKI